MGIFIHIPVDIRVDSAAAPESGLTHPARRVTIFIMSVIITFRDKTFEVRPGITVREAVRACGLQPEAVLPVREGQLITEDVVLKDGDRIKLVAVISGGSWGQVAVRHEMP